MNTEQILSLFKSPPDGMRPNLEKIFRIDEWVYSTDGMILIRTKYENCDFVVESPENAPRCEEVIPKVNKKSELIINKSDFDKLITEDEYEEAEIDCKVCDGHGEVEWEFERWTREDDCPNCDGSGYEDSRKKTGNKTFKSFQLVKLGNAYFDISKFYKIVLVSDALNEPVFLISSNIETSANLLKVGNFEIVIMSVIYKEDSSYEVVFEIFEK